MTRHTVARTAELSGTGLHTGAACRVRIAPGVAGEGIVFVREGWTVPARLEHVVSTERRTVLQSGPQRIETVEHLLAATWAVGVDDLIVHLDGPELPILDGSFAPFLALLDQGGRAERAGSVRRAVLEHSFAVVDGEARYLVEPAEAFGIEVTLDFTSPVIGRQTVAFTVTADEFRTGIAGARSFGFLAEVEALGARGLLRGATRDCAIVLSETEVLNTTLRWPDEFARHKAGDLLGDLTLLGSRLAMRVSATRPSHRGNVACARAIAARARYLEA